MNPISLKIIIDSDLCSNFDKKVDHSIQCKIDPYNNPHKEQNENMILNLIENEIRNKI